MKHVGCVQPPVVAFYRKALQWNRAAILGKLIELGLYVGEAPTHTVRAPQAAVSYSHGGRYKPEPIIFPLHTTQGLLDKGYSPYDGAPLPTVVQNKLRAKAKAAQKWKPPEPEGPPPGAWTEYDYQSEPSTAQSSKATAPKEEPDTQPVGEPRKATPVKLEPNPQRTKRSRCGLSPDEKAEYRTEFPDDGSSSDASMQSDHDWVTLDAYKHRVFASLERKNAEKMHLNLSLGNPPRPKVVLQRPPPQRHLVKIFVGSTPAMLFKAGFRTYRIIDTASKARRLARGSRLKIKNEDAGSIVLSLRASCHWTTTISECSLEPSFAFGFLHSQHWHGSGWSQALTNLTEMLSRSDVIVGCGFASKPLSFFWNSLWEGGMPSISAGQAIQQGDEQVNGGCDDVSAPTCKICLLLPVCSIRTSWSTPSWRSASYDEACSCTQLSFEFRNDCCSLSFFSQGPLRPRPFFPFWRHGPLFLNCLDFCFPCQDFCMLLLSSLDCDGTFHRALDCTSSVD